MDFGEEEMELTSEFVICSECSGLMRYKGGGCYVCEDCGHEVLNDFGKVRQFLEKRGPSNVFEISAGTGIARPVINRMLRDGRLEVSSHSSVSLVCERCGMPIRYGVYCNKCMSDLGEIDARNKKKGVYNVFKGDKEGDDGKMRFLKDD